MCCGLDMGGGRGMFHWVLVSSCDKQPVFSQVILFPSSAQVRPLLQDQDWHEAYMGFFSFVLGPTPSPVSLQLSSCLSLPGMGIPNLFYKVMNDVYIYFFKVFPQFLGSQAEYKKQMPCSHPGAGIVG